MAFYYLWECVSCSRRGREFFDTEARAILAAKRHVDSCKHKQGSKIRILKTRGKK